MHDGRADRLQAPCLLNEQPVPPAPLAKFDFGKHDTWPGNFLCGSDHLGCARDYRFAFLVFRLAVERDAMLLGMLLRNSHCHGDRIAEADRTAELQRLAEI